MSSHFALNLASARYNFFITAIFHSLAPYKEVGSFYTGYAGPQAASLRPMLRRPTLRSRSVLTLIPPAKYIQYC